MVSHVVWQSSGWSWCSLLGLGPNQRLGIRSDNKYGLVEHFVRNYSAWFFLFHGKRGLHRSLLEQVIFVCTNHFVLICVYVCKSAFYLYDNDCLCSPWNIASAKSWFCVYTHVCVHLGILPLQLESRKSLWLWKRLSTITACGGNFFLKLCSCLLTWTFMSCQKTNSVCTNSFMK